MLRSLLVLTAWAICLCCFAGEQTRTVKLEEAGIVEIPCETASSATKVVEYDVRGPLDLEYLSYELAHDAGWVAVFYAEAGKQYVIDVRVTEWTGERLEFDKVRWIVTVEGDPAPNPNPPDPDDDRPLGIAGEVYDEALKANQPDKASAIATAWETVRSECAARANMTPREAQQKINAQLNTLSLSGWATFGRKINQLLQTHAKSRQGFLDISEQIILGLEAAAKKR